MKISAIICTLNRHEILESACLSLHDQSLNKDFYEIVVVDNGSTDNTKETVERLRFLIPNLHYLCEPKMGLSNARNRGMVEAGGEIVAFLDDDAVADRKWLEELYSVYQKDKSVAAAGGKIHLIWKNGKPSWVNSSIEGYFGKYDLGEAEKILIYPEYPFGSNMSIRRQIALNSGGFRSALGRKGNNLIAAEETDLFCRLSRIGGKVVYEPRAVVHHHVLAERISKLWGLRRAFDHGRSISMLNSFYENKGRSDWLNQAVRTIPKIIGKALTMSIRLFRARDQQYFQQMMGAAYWAGIFNGCLKNALNKGTNS